MNQSRESQRLLWVYPRHSPDWCAKIVKELHIHPVTAQILVSRGYASLDEIYEFLYAKLPNLHSPSLLLGMDQATDRIAKALMEKQTILVYGDNDVDGITGTALLVGFLRSLGATVLYHLPNRNRSLSSLTTDVLTFAAENRCKLMITVDCGITAAQEIDTFSSKDIDVIVTDHHESTDTIPRCIATLNPKLKNSSYPNRDLTGVGVAFKLAHALTNLLVSTGKISATKIDLKNYLDLVALGTIADMGALIGENRILVRYGLRKFAKTKRPGLLKLMEIADVEPTRLQTVDIAAKIAPRLNSLGRIANPTKGVELLLTQDEKQASLLAKELNDNNLERQKIEKRDIEDLEALLLHNPALLNNRAIALHSEKWHPGIVPLLSTRISKQYNRPTLITTIEEGIGKGSIRTIPEFPVLPPLRDLKSLLLNFGGHDFAAGFVIEEKKIPEFEKEFIERANHALKKEDILPKLPLDAPIAFADLTFEFLDSMQLLEPYGMGNPPPILYSEAIQSWMPKVIGKSHLKLYLEQKERVLEGIAFGAGHSKAKLMKKHMKLKVAFTPHVSLFMNKSSIQLMIKDFQILP